MSIFKFKQFNIIQTNAPQKVGTDAMVLGALAVYKNPKSILDVGTGSGVIALMLAQKYPDSKVTGLDIDKETIFLAETNFNNAVFPNKFEVFSQNFLTFNPAEKFDLIVTNPPYFNTKMPSVDELRTLARHESSMSLKDLINHSLDLLNDRGELWMIVPTERAEELIQSENELNLGLKHRIPIYGKPNRHVRDVLVFSRYLNDFKDNVSELIIRNEEGGYSDQYKQLTIDYHYNKL
ncbi:MAG TPA: methyltransferase [Brumimicrobium sp.]|nr:methyltransferase [Brumimicrobium sp.]